MHKVSNTPDLVTIIFASVLHPTSQWYISRLCSKFSKSNPCQFQNRHHRLNLQTTTVPFVVQWEVPIAFIRYQYTAMNEYLQLAASRVVHNYIHNIG